MSKPINVYDAKTNLSRLIDRAARGEEIVIARNGRPVAKLVAFTRNRSARRLGIFKDGIRIAPDFDELPDELRELFQGQGE